MHLARKMALLNFEKCRPEMCEGGVCAALQACSLKLLRHDVPHSMPTPEPSACRACGDCVRACPEKAIQLVSL